MRHKFLPGAQARSPVRARAPSARSVGAIDSETRGARSLPGSGNLFEDLGNEVIGDLSSPELVDRREKYPMAECRLGHRPDVVGRQR